MAPASGRVNCQLLKLGQVTGSVTPSVVIVLTSTGAVPVRLTKLVPVVVLTSTNQEIDVVRAYDLGANSYLVKPVESEAFMKSVNELGLYWMILNKLPGETG